MNNSWVVQSNLWFRQEISSLHKELSGIYTVRINQQTQELFLERIGENFSFDYKVYGLEEQFIDRCIFSYNSTKGNLGVLMNGIKGSGKSVSSKILTNKLKLPVLLITEKFDNLPTFLNTIQQDIVVFFDEYDKIYDNYDSSILTVMDGVLSSSYRRFFLLTSNDCNLNANMMQRPSRIRYVKEFRDLSTITIEEIIDDCLIHIQHRENILAFIKSMEIITVDLVKSIIEEVNIHNEDPAAFKDIFNISSPHGKMYDVFIVDVDKNILIPYKTSVKITPNNMNVMSYGKYVYIDNQYYGKLTKMVGNDIIVVNLTGDEYDDIIINTKNKNGDIYFKLAESTSLNRMYEHIV